MKENEKADKVRIQTAEQQRTTIAKAAMLDALKASLGVITQAARQVGIDPRTHYKWYDSDPEYRDRYDELRDLALDYAETQLYSHMKHNVAACIFYLKTKGRHRGYIEKQEIEANMAVHQTTRVDLSHLSKDELRQLDAILTKAAEGGQAGSEPAPGLPGPTG